MVIGQCGDGLGVERLLCAHGVDYKDELSYTAAADKEQFDD